MDSDQLLEQCRQIAIDDIETDDITTDEIIERCDDEIRHLIHLLVNQEDQDEAVDALNLAINKALVFIHRVEAEKELRAFDV